MATYREAGVDLEAADQTVEMIRPLAAATQGPQVLAGVGPFAGLFALEPGRFREPVLVASTDGVGTKVLLAYGAHRHWQVGVDLVNHCVNDVLTTGAEPLFFLDYVATGMLQPPIIAELVAGMADACRKASCALLGGETAEMPGIYQGSVYDVAGFMVGISERDALIDGTRIQAGDAVLALPSSGLHTNGYSLARRVLPQHAMQQRLHPDGPTLLDSLLATHRSYLDPVRRLRAQVDIKGLAHITGGGVIGNLPRILPTGLGAEIARGSWPEPEIFKYLSPFVPDEDLWRTFNMGLGMIVIVSQDAAEVALQALPNQIFQVGVIVPTASQPRVVIEE